MVTRTTAEPPAPIEPLFTGEDVLRFHEIVRKVPIAEEMVRYAVQLAAASRPHQTECAGFHQRMGQLGRRHARRAIPGRSAPRRARCCKGRAHVTMEDIQHARLSRSCAIASCSTTAPRPKA